MQIFKCLKIISIIYRSALYPEKSTTAPVTLLTWSSQQRDMIMMRYRLKYNFKNLRRLILSDRLDQTRKFGGKFFLPLKYNPLPLWVLRSVFCNAGWVLPYHTVQSSLRHNSGIERTNRQREMPYRDRAIKICCCTRIEFRDSKGVSCTIMSWGNLLRTKRS